MQVLGKTKLKYALETVIVLQDHAEIECKLNNL